MSTYWFNSQIMHYKNAVPFTQELSEIKLDRLSLSQSNLSSVISDSQGQNPCSEFSSFRFV